MEDYWNPSKKPRLENSLDAWENEFGGNDDLWGQDDITAEEFDMLEIQASQQVNKRNDVINNEISVPGPSNKSKKFGKSLSMSTIRIECDDPLLEKYALEGKIKLLTNSLEKTEKELTDERLNREQIISAKLNQYKNNEISLLEEIEKLQTAIQFKEQEVRVERSKSLALENKLKHQQKENQSTGLHDVAEKPSFRNLTCSKRSPSKFPNRYSFEAKSQVKAIEVAAQTDSLRHRKFQLSLRDPRGEIKEADIVATLLSAKVFSTSAFSIPYQGCQAPDSKNEVFKRLPDSSTAFSDGEQLENLCKSYEIILQDYLTLLKEQNLNHLMTPCVSRKAHDAFGDEFKFSSPNMMESESQSPKIVSCLKEIARLLGYYCPKSIPKEVCWQKIESDLLSAHSRPLFGSDEEMEVVEIQQGHSLAELLCTFANPNIYPVEYSKTCEVEWALVALTAWASHSIESIESHIFRLPLHALVSGKHGMGIAYNSLKFMIHLITSKYFEKELVHLSGCCIFCSIGSLCHSIHSNLDLHSTCLLITAVEEFLSGVFTTAGLSLFCKKEYSCSTLVIQGVISMLWLKVTSDEDDFQSCCIHALKQGAILLAFMATHVEGFRVRRMQVEDSYIYLISCLSRLCRKNHNFKQLQEMIRDLWDFQDDVNEFDIE